MIEYGLIADGQVVERRRYPDSLHPDTIKLGEDGLPVLRHIVKAPPAYDRRYQGLGAAINTILDDRVVETYAVVERSLEEITAAKVSAIKTEAEQRINALAPVFKQLNLMRRFDGIRSSAESTVEEIAEMETIRGLFSQIDAIRAASDAHEAALEGLTVAQVAAYDHNVGWPE